MRSQLFFLIILFAPIWSETKNSKKLNSPWMENLVELPIANSTVLSEFLNGNETEIPKELKPFLNETALFDWRNRTETKEWTIRDEDVDEPEIPDLNKAFYDGEKTTINISSEAGEQLFQHWVDQAVSGLLAAVATKKLENLGNEQKNEHHNCTKHVKTVAAHAKCVVRLMDSKPKSTRKEKIKHKKVKKVKKQNWIGSFRFKRELRPSRNYIKTQSTYMLKTPKRPTFLAQIAQKLTKTVRAFKNKGSDDFNWQQTLDDIMVEAKKLHKIEKVKKMMQKRIDTFSEVAKDLGIQENPGFKAFDFVKDDEPTVMTKEEQIRNAREKEKNMTTDEKMMRAPIQLIREGIKLGMALSGKDVSKFDNKTIKMISPRVMSLVPEEEEENDTVNLLSPSLFSFYNKSNSNEMLSFPSLTKIFDDNGHQEMMNLVFEASGVSDAVSYMKILQQEKEKEQFMDRLRADAIEKKKSTFTREEIVKNVGDEERRRIDHLEKLHHMFTEDQIGKLNKTGYFGMTDEQIEFIYGTDSPFNNSHSLSMYRNITEQQQHEAVENTIRKLASEEMSFKMKRQKDIVLQWLVLTALIEAPEIASQPIILTPVILSTLILSPAVFGVVVLSPWVFVPLILSPRILGPIVLNPFAFVPVILSPLALNPVILSPGVGLPLILSPLLLNPFILTPVGLKFSLSLLVQIVLTPLILSPFCLSPFIADPNVLTPLILSPFVLSPLIWSPPAVSAFVMSPYALSPIIQSDGAVFTAVLSPSWLS